MYLFGDLRWDDKKTPSAGTTAIQATVVGCLESMSAHKRLIKTSKNRLLQ